MRLSKSVTREHDTGPPPGESVYLGVTVIADYQDADDGPALAAVLAGMEAWQKLPVADEDLTWEVIYERFRACFPSLEGVDYSLRWYSSQGLIETREIR